jgi:prephenate dehydrogenase
MRAQTVTILGLDRIGASIGLALRQADLGLKVVGHEVNQGEAERAKALGAVDEISSDARGAMVAADIVILSLPLGQVEEALTLAGPEIQAHTLVIDLAPRKGPGLKWAAAHLQRGHYVGAVPVLAAEHLNDGRQGVEAARADLFRRSVFCIMPSPEAEPKAVDTAVNLGRLLGATPFFLDPMEFDALVQGVGTVPGLLAAALFRSVRQATGWRDVLRFAGPSFALATLPLEDEDLAMMSLQDRLSTLRWLEAVMAELEQVRRWIREGDEERLSLILSDLDAQRSIWLNERDKNDWTEEPESEMAGYDMKTALFGTVLGSGKKKDRKS